MIDHLDPRMPDARGIAAQCWCDPETEHIEMDTRLAEAFAMRLVESVAAERERCAKVCDDFAADPDVTDQISATIRNLPT